MYFALTRKKVKKMIAMILSGCLIFVYSFSVTGVADAGTFEDSIAANGTNNVKFSEDVAFSLFLSQGKNGDGFQGRWKMLTQKQLDSIKDEASARSIFGEEGTGQLYYSDIDFSATSDGKTLEKDTVASGLNLKSVANRLGYVSGTDGKTQLTAIGPDGTVAHSGSFAFEEDKYYFENLGATGQSIVSPMLKLGSGKLPSLRTGQSEAADTNKSEWKDDVEGLQIDSITTATQRSDVVLDVEKGASKTEYIMNDVASLDQYNSKYYYYGGNGTDQITASVKGVKLSDLLSDKKITAKSNDIVEAVNSSGSKFLVDQTALDKYFVAYDGNEETNWGTPSNIKSKSEFCLFAPAGTQSAAKFTDFYGIEITSAPSVPAVNAASSGYNSVKVSWSKVTGAAGYEVYSTDTGNVVARVGSGSTSCTVKGLKTGKKYGYKVRAYSTSDSGKKAYSAYSASKYTKPVPAKTKISKISKSGSRSLKVTWKKVSGATGYCVYMATKSKGKYKKIGTIKKGKTTKYTKKKLKKGKRYYFKVRAFRKSGKSMVYGPYSTVKYKKR